jgi:hypothetical protein
VNHPSTLPGWAQFRASLLRWLLRSRARGPITPMSDHSNLDDHASLDASEEGTIAGDLVPLTPASSPAGARSEDVVMQRNVGTHPGGANRDVGPSSDATFVTGLRHRLVEPGSRLP